MINDVPSHIGALVEHPVIGLIDSKENILANKLTAVIDRTLPKDIEKEIKWISPVSGETIKHYLNTLSISIVEGTI